MPKKKPTARGRPAKPGKPNTKRRQDRPLTDAQQLFIERYMVHRVAARAYREAYPEASRATADSHGPALRKDGRIASEIKRRLAELTARYRHSAERTLRELSFMAHGSLLDLFGDDGSMLQPQDIPDEVGRALKKLEYEAIYSKDTDGNRIVIGHVIKAEMHSKPEALKLLGQHYDIFREKVEITASSEFADLLRAARERVAAR